MGGPIQSCGFVQSLNLLILFGAGKQIAGALVRAKWAWNLPRHHMQLKDAQQMRTATLRKLFFRPVFEMELSLHRLDCLASSGQLENFDFLQAKFEAFQDQPELQKPLLNGNDLIALGQAPGSGFGVLLKKARELQLEGELTTRDQALVWLEAKVGAAGD